MKESKDIKDRTLPFLLIQEKEKKEKEEAEKKEQLVSRPININTDVVKKSDNTVPTTEVIQPTIINQVNTTPLKDDKQIVESIPLVEKTRKEGETVVTTSTTTETPTDVTPVIVDMIPMSDKEVSIKTEEVQQERGSNTITTTATTKEATEEERPVIVDMIPISTEPVIIPVEEEKQVETESEEKEETTSTTLTTITPLSQEEQVHLTIIEEIKEFIDDDLKEVEDLAYKIEVLQEQEEDTVLVEEEERIKKELQELERKIEELRTRYEKLYEKLKIQNIEIIDNDILEISIKDYIEDTKEGQDTSKYFDQIEEVTIYIDILNRIIELDQAKDELSTKVDEKVEQFEEKEQSFEEAQDKKVDIEKINVDIETYNEIVRKSLEQLKEKMSRSTEISSRIETSSRRAINWGRILVAIVMLSQTPRIPPTPRGTYLRAGLVAVAIHLLLHATYRENTTRRINTITYTDFRQEILSSKEMLTESLKLIGTSFDELQQFKKMLEDEFGEYADQIPEYSKLIKSLIDLEKELQRQEEKANEYKKEIEERLEVNEEKIKRIEEYTTVE